MSFFPPQGTEELQSLRYRLRPNFWPPQGIGDATPIEVDLLLALFPPIGDMDYNNYKFYQINPGQIPNPTDTSWMITDSVGPGVLQQALGFDIRAFEGKGRVLSQAQDTGVTFDSQMDSQMAQLSPDELHLFIWAVTGVIHEWVLSAPHVFPSTGTPSDFTFSPSTTTGRDIKFFDNGNKMAIIGQPTNAVEIYSLPIRNSLKDTPILQQSFTIPAATTSTPSSCEFSNDGLELYVVGRAEDELYQWNLTSPFTLPTAGTPHDITFPFNPPIEANIGNMRMLSDGSAFYLVSNNPDDTIAKYFTDGKNQIPSVNKDPEEEFTVTFLDNNPRAITLSTDESHIWFYGRGNELFYELFIPGISLIYEITSVNISTGDFTIVISFPDLRDSSFIQLTFGNPTALDGSAAVPFGDIFSTHETPLLTAGEDHHLVDDQGRRIKVVGQ